MADSSAGAAAIADSAVEMLVHECDEIAHFAPREGWAAIRLFRFVPLSYLINHCDVACDHGIDHLLYLQSLIDEEG